MSESSDPNRRLLSRDSELPSLTSAPVAPGTKRGRRMALAVLMLLAFLVVAWMAAPLWVGLVLGTVMAFTAQPLYRKLALLVSHRRPLASLMTTVIGAVLTAAGFAVLIYILISEANVLKEYFEKNLDADHPEQIIGHTGVDVVKALGLDPKTVINGAKSQLGELTSHVGSAAVAIASTMTSALLSLVIAGFTMYYVLLEWPHIAVRLEKLLPLDPRHTRALMLEFRDVGRSAFIGTMATAAVQGTLAGVGFAVVPGLSQPITWGVLTALASFLPVVGTAMVWIPMGVWLVLHDQPWWGVFVFAWGGLIVMAVSDYVIRPRLVGSHGQGHPLLMLIALLGGIEVFGLAGLITGPVLMSLFLAIVRIYEREVSADALEGPPAAGSRSAG